MSERVDEDLHRRDTYPSPCPRHPAEVEELMRHLWTWMRGAAMPAREVEKEEHRRAGRAGAGRSATALWEEGE